MFGGYGRIATLRKFFHILARANYADPSAVHGGIAVAVVDLPPRLLRQRQGLLVTRPFGQNHIHDAPALSSSELPTMRRSPFPPDPSRSGCAFLLPPPRLAGCARRVAADADACRWRPASPHPPLSPAVHDLKRPVAGPSAWRRRLLVHGTPPPLCWRRLRRQPPPPPPPAPRAAVDPPNPPPPPPPRRPSRHASSANPLLRVATIVGDTALRAGDATARSLAEARYLTWPPIDNVIKIAVLVSLALAGSVGFVYVVDGVLMGIFSRLLGLRYPGGGG